MRPIFFIFFMFLLFSCNKPMTEPESLDPIYKELLNDYANSNKETEDLKKRVQEFPEQFNHIIPQTGQTKKVYAEYFKLKSDLVKLEQQTEYLRLSVKTRKYDARKSYMKSFEAGLSWPDPNEYESYKTNKQVNNIDLDWRKRYPSTSGEKGKPKGKPSKESASH